MAREARRTSRRMNVAAEDHQGLDRFGHECRRLVGVGEGVRAWACGGCIADSGGKDLGLDDARVAVVDGAEHGDRAAVLPRVAHEQLTRSVRDSGRHLAWGAEAADRRELAHPPTAALCAACATVSLSANPSIRTARVAGRR